MQFAVSLPEADTSAFDFVAVGEGGVDVVSIVDRLPLFDEKVTAINRRVLPGGQAASSAVGVARLGWRSRWIGAVGDDSWGRVLCNALERDGVLVSAPRRMSVATRSALILVQHSTGKRAVVESRDSALNVEADEFSHDDLGSGRVILVDGTDIELSLRAAAAAIRKGRRVIVDLDCEHPKAWELLNQIDVVVLPEPLVCGLTGFGSIGEALSKMERELPRAAAVVATMGDRGVLGRSSGSETHVPAFPVDVIDTTGAGDAFRAGFVARWLDTSASGAEFPDLLEYAALVAALACREVGAQAGLPTREQVSHARRAKV